MIKTYCIHPLKQLELLRQDLNVKSWTLGKQNKKFSFKMKKKLKLDFNKDCQMWEARDQKGKSGFIALKVLRLFYFVWQ